MAAMALKQQVIDYVDQLDDERTELVLVFAQSLTDSKASFRNSKTASERVLAAKALAELENVNFTPKSATSLDGRTERTEALWRKYESPS